LLEQRFLLGIRQPFRRGCGQCDSGCHCLCISRWADIVSSRDGTIALVVAPDI